MEKVRCQFRFSNRADRSPLSVCFHLKTADGTCWLPEAGPASGSRHPNLVLGPDLWSYVGHHTGPHPGRNVIYVLDGEIEFELAPGRYEAFISRGFEWEPVRRTIEVAAHRPNHFEFTLEPALLARRDGWINGDVHLHFRRSSHIDSEFWRRIFAAHDLGMGNVMTYNHGTPDHETTQFAYGHRGEHHHHGGVIASGEEIRDNDLFGHMTTTGISRIIEPVSVGRQIGLRENFPYFADFCDRVHRAKGLVGFAHGGTGGTGNWVIYHSLPVEAALGKLDFLEIIQFNQFLGFPYWYALLNCGIRLPCVAGSDWPWVVSLSDWHSGIGNDRTFVRTEDGAQDYRSWLDGIRHGRTFASNGPILLLQVNGQSPGAELRAPNRKVRVTATAWAAHPLEQLAVVRNGEVALFCENAGGRNRLELEGEIAVSRDSWIAARCHGRAEPSATGGVIPWNLYAHTSPIYVKVDGRGIADPVDALRMADSVRFIREYARRRGFWKTPRQREGYQRLCARAIQFYERIAFAAFRRGRRRTQ